jgi:hypothetical protein
MPLVLMVLIFRQPFRSFSPAMVCTIALEETLDVACPCHIHIVQHRQRGASG